MHQTMGIRVDGVTCRRVVGAVGSFGGANVYSIVAWDVGVGLGSHTPPAPYSEASWAPMRVGDSHLLSKRKRNCYHPQFGC
jgi:hypothetical protein